MHLLVILLQHLLGLIPNKRQAQPEPVRVRTVPPNTRGERTPEQQAFQSSYGLHGHGAELFRSGAMVFSESTASVRPSRAALRAGGGGFCRAGATSVDGTFPVDQSRSPASPISLKSQGASSPELRS